MSLFLFLSSSPQVVSTLTELLRDNFRNSRIKLALLPTLGELLHYIASQEEVKGQAVESWSINQMTYTLIIRCLREGVSDNFKTVTAI